MGDGSQFTIEPFYINVLKGLDEVNTILIVHVIQEAKHDYNIGNELIPTPNSIF